MTYEWESKITDEILAKVDDLIFTETGLTVAGVAVANTETGEAALLPSPTGEVSSVTEADYRKDILGDAHDQYSEAVDTVFQIAQAERVK